MCVCVWVGGGGGVDFARRPGLLVHAVQYFDQPLTASLAAVKVLCDSVSQRMRVWAGGVMDSQVIT